LPAAHRELIERIDLDDENIGRVAADPGLTRNNYTVRFHRACNHLRDELPSNCRIFDSP
jgi:DNA-directed RNA polymerase specialized sigma24 family protein